MRILVVEDEQRLASTIADLLAGERYLVDVVYDGEVGLDAALSGIYDCAILDVMLPKLDGFAVVQQLRQQGSALPVLMLTARTQTGDRVKGLDCGADYYLTKPFQTEELLACLRALLRRQSEVVREVLCYGDLKLDILSGELGCGERSVQLSAKELELLRLLMKNRDMIVSKETLVLKVWGYDCEAESNVLEVYISFLRRKLKHIHSKVQIEAVRRMGYHLREGIE